MKLKELYTRLETILIDENKNNGFNDTLSPIDKLILESFETENYDDDVENWIHDLELAHCEAGSFGETLIWNNRIYEFLRQEDVLENIDEILEQIECAVNIDEMKYATDVLKITSIVRYVVNWRASEIAYIVQNIIDEGEHE